MNRLIALAAAVVVLGLAAAPIDAAAQAPQGNTCRMEQHAIG